MSVEGVLDRLWEATVQNERCEPLILSKVVVIKRDIAHTPVGSICGVMGCQGHHMTNPCRENSAIPPAFTMSMDPKTGGCNTVGEAVAIELAQTSIEASMSTIDAVELEESISKLGSLKRGLVSEHGTFKRRKTSSKSTSVLPPFVDVLMNRKASLLRRNCMKKMLLGGVVAVCVPDPDMDQSYVAIPSSCIFPTGIMVISRYPIMNDTSIRYATTIYHDDGPFIKLHPSVMDSMMGDFDGDTISAMFIPSTACTGLLPHFKNLAEVDKVTSTDGQEVRAFTMGDLKACYDEDTREQLHEESAYKRIVASGCVKKRMLETTFEKSLDRWRECAINDSLMRCSTVQSVKSLAMSGRMQGIAGDTFRRLRLSLEPLRIKSCGAITWKGIAIGTTTPLQATSLGPDTPISMGAGMMIACCLGVMMQQDFLDLHKLHVMGIKPTKLALHLCNPPDAADMVLVITRPNRVFTSDGFSCFRSYNPIVRDTAQSDMLAQFMGDSSDRLKGTQIATGSTVSCMDIENCIDIIQHVSRHREFVYGAGIKSAGYEGSPPWFTYAYVELLCRGSVPDQCMDALNCAICSGAVHPDLKPEACGIDKGLSRSFYSNSMIHGASASLKDMTGPGKQNRMSSVNEPCVAKLLGNFRSSRK